jgi:hypothetical protein
MFLSSEGLRYDLIFVLINDVADALRFQHLN